MEILNPASFYTMMDWGSMSRAQKWTAEDNKKFEDALAVYDSDTPDRWQRVAEMIPGKTVADVMRQYKELEDDVSSIEAGLLPVNWYNCNNNDKGSFGNSSSCSVSASGFRVFDWGGSGGSGGGGGRRSRPLDQERKKGIPWTEKEHRLFLLGLKKYGKGDWRNISRNYVITRTPTQVASHAQKYFIRQLSGGKDKRRASIHDITTVNLNENQTNSPENQTPPSPDHSSMLCQQTNSISGSIYQWNRPNNGLELGFGSTHGNLFVPSFGNGLKVEDQNFQYVGAQNTGFQMNLAHLYSHV